MNFMTETGRENFLVRSEHETWSDYNMHDLQLPTAWDNSQFYPIRVTNLKVVQVIASYIWINIGVEIMLLGQETWSWGRGSSGGRGI